MSGGGMSFGAIPDMIAGKDPKKAILDNMKMAAIVGTGMAAAPAIAGAGTASGIAGSAAPAAEAGLMGSLKTASSFAKPLGEAMSAAQSANSLLNPDQGPIQAGQLRQGGFDASGLLAASNQQLENLKQKRMNRRNQG